MARLLAGLGGAILAALPAVVLALTSAPNDTFFPQQWALHGAPSSTNAPSTWCAAMGAGVKVADVDTGADFSHPDLSGKLIRGASFQSGTGQPDGKAVDDGYGHGTMTTGIMVADTNNRLGIAGEAPGAVALIVKVLDNSGSGSENDVAAGIQWAADNGASVINVSIGPEIPLSGIASQLAGDPLVQAIDYAAQRGKLVVLAAGNSSLPAADYLQVESEALVAGALGPRGEVAYYSNNGQGVNIYGPGGDAVTSGNASNEILSTYIAQNGQEDQYAEEQGTSFATPYVAGVAALLVGHGYSPLAARARILQTARSSASGVPQVDAPAALGSCPAGGGSSAAGSAGTGGGASGGGAGTAGARTPAPRASASPAAAASADAASASTQHLGRAATQVRHVAPPALGIAILVLGVLSLGAAAAWYWRQQRQ